jgi:hypothetical protein
MVQAANRFPTLSAYRDCFEYAINILQDDPKQQSIARIFFRIICNAYNM